jgi:hypothetical protein
MSARDEAAADLLALVCLVAICAAFAIAMGVS